MPKRLETQHKIGLIEKVGEPVKADSDYIQRFLTLTPGWADKAIKPILATEGWMSKGGVDRVGDIVDPGGWELEDFLLYPAFMFHHDWSKMLLGIWTSVDIRNEGLFGRNVIYATDIGNDAALLINAGVYRAYSVGFNPLEFSFMEEGGIHFQRQSLIETSLVPSPAHLGATIESVETIKTAEIIRQANEHNLTLKYFTAPKKSFRKGNTMTPEEIAALEQKMVGTADAKIAAATQKQAEVTTSELGEKFKKVAQLEAQMNDLASKPSLTEGEAKQLIENVTKDYAKLFKDLQDEIKTVKSRKNISIAPQLLPGTLRGLMSVEKSVIRGSLAPAQAEQLLRLHKMNDEMLFVDAALETSSRNNGGDYHEQKKADRIQNLKMFGPISDFAKAMDTATADEGTEWVHIAVSGSLLEDVRQATIIAPLFREVPMTGKTMEIDTDDGDTFAKLIGEKKTVVSGFDSNEETYASGNITLTSKKARGRYQISTELTEDAAVAVMPIYRAAIVRSIARSEDRSVINGNDAADANLDSGRTLDSTDFRKAYKGLRYAWFQTINSGTAGSVIGIDGATHNEGVHTDCRAEMGKYALPADSLRIFASVKGHLKRLLRKDEMEIFQTLDKYGPQAVVLTGEAGRIYNVPVINSEFMDDNLNAAGIFDNTTTDRTAFLYVNTDMFIRGLRRGVEVLSERDIINDVWDMVAFKRVAFEPTFTPSSTVTSVNVIYNVAT